jgi:2-polyprenyl-3-methyl-5-hydroxy-6-metoxy-1,4-benzoquinol methylase
MARIDEQKLKKLLEKAGLDIGTTMSSALVYIGQKTGLYKAMAASGPSTPAQIAERSGTVERYVCEWLINQVASGYVEYDSQTDRYYLTPEQEVVLADEESPVYVGGFYSAKAVLQVAERVADSFRNGGGVPWSEQDPDLFFGTEHTFRPVYSAFLVRNWIPALSGVEAKLISGGNIADIGCGHGSSTLLMARAYPRCTVYGFDNHEESIKRARLSAMRAGVTGRTLFQVANSDSFPPGPYDLITFFVCLHDMADPIAAARRAFETLTDEGSVLIVETMAGETIEENRNEISRIFSAVSTLCCLSNSLAEGGQGLGAVATEAKIRETLMAGGFKFFRRIGESPINRVFEARKK